MVDPITVVFSPPLDFRLNGAFLAYLAGTSAEESWARSGVSGYRDKDNSQSEKDLITAFSELMRQGTTPEDKVAITQNAANYFHRLILNEPVVQADFSDKKFIFVIGAPRTGGTFVLTQLYRAHGMDHTKYHRPILRDSLPRSYVIADSLSKISGVHGLASELGQLLAWAEDRCDETVIIKNNAAGHALRYLNDIFQKNATYYLTLRHPVDYLASTLQQRYSIEDFAILLTKIRDRKICFDVDCSSLVAMISKTSELVSRSYDVKNPYLQHLAYWEHYYSMMAAQYPDIDLRIVEYGKDDAFIKAFGDDFRNFAPDGLQWRHQNRDYSSFLEAVSVDMDLVKNAIANVARRWARRGMKFPDYD